MKKLFVLFLFAIAIKSDVFSQTYSRLSVTPIYLNHKSGGLSFVKNADNVSISEKYDYNFFGNNKLNVDFDMVSPSSILVSNLSSQIAALVADNPLGSDQIKGLREKLSKANEQAKIDDSLRFPKILQSINSNKVANKILSSILIDSKIGYMTTEVIAKRAEYNASDADVIKAMNSETKMAAIRDQGQNLLKNIYFVVFDNQSMTETSPVKEDSRCKNKMVHSVAYLFQIDIDSLIRTGQFDPLIFTEENPAKAEVFRNYNFPIKFIMKSDVDASVDNYTIDSKSAGKALANSLLSGGNVADAKLSYIIRNEYEINNELINGLFSDADYKFTKKHDPFKVKVSVFSTSPITAKIGKKEALNIDDLFKVTENVIKKDGSKFERKIGWVRAKKVSDNKKNADGKTTPSVFYKVASRNVEKGMKLTQKQELGILLGVSYNVAENNVMSGPELNVDFISHTSPGLRFGFGIGGFGTISPDVVSISNNPVSKDVLDFKGTNIYADLTIQKILQANRVELTPYVGAYLSMLSIDKYYLDRSEYQTADAESLKGLANTAYGAVAGIKFGYNIARNTQINFGYKLGFEIGSSLKCDNGEVTYDGIQPISMSFKMPSALTVGLRLFGF